MSHGFEIKEKELIIELKGNEFLSIPKELVRAICDEMHSVYRLVGISDYMCDCGAMFDFEVKYCYDCGAKLDWDEHYFAIGEGWKRGEE